MSNEHNNAPAVPVAWWIPKAEQFCLAKPSGERPFAKAWEPLYAAAPAVPQDMRLVPVSLLQELESSMHALGQGLDFTSVDTGRYNRLREVIAATPAPAPAFNGWYCAHCQRGVDGSDVTHHEQHTVCGRVITDDVPPAPAPAQEPVDMVPRAALHEVERERDWYKTRAQTMHEHQNGQVWYWQGDGEDHPENLVNSLPVVIRADQLRELIAKPAQEVGLTDEEIDAIASEYMSTVGDHWCNEEAIRERHAEDFARAIIAALRAKGAL